MGPVFDLNAVADFERCTYDVSVQFQSIPSSESLSPSHDQASDSYWPPASDHVPRWG